MLDYLSNGKGCKILVKCFDLAMIKADNASTVSLSFGGEENIESLVNNLVDRL